MRTGLPDVKVTLLGTGAMACLFGARLAPYAQVTLLGTWREAVQAIRARGIRLEGTQGIMTVSVQATDRPEECIQSDLLLVLVKSWQTMQAVQRAAPCLALHGLALTLQNGLGNFEILERTFGPERAALGVTTMGATLLSPGEIRLGGDGPIYLGYHPRIEIARSVLALAGFQVHLTPDISSLVWGKLVINAAINPLGALLRVPNGELVARPAARALMLAVTREAAAVAQAKGVRLPYPDPEEKVCEVAWRTASNRSSMLQDVERGRPTEIDAINGAIVRQANAIGLKAPLNWALWQLVRALDSND